MTSPKYAKSTARGRQYINPITGESYPSVTTVLGQVGKGEALKWWAAAETAKYAVNMKETWLHLDNDAAIDLLKREPLRSLNRAADRGTDVHAIADHYARTGQKPTLDVHSGYVEALLRFFREQQPLPVLVESTVYGSLGYAGSFDMVCRLPALDDKLIILDYKTSKAIYNDTSAQLAAYAHAEHYLTDDDQLVPMPKIEGGVVVRFGADGEYEIKVADLDAGWELFKAAHAVYNALSLDLMKGFLTAGHDFDPTPTRQNIIKRVSTIKEQHPDLMPELVASWIPNLPPLTSDEHLDRHQLMILNKLVDKVESKTDAPFDPPSSLRANAVGKDVDLPVAQAEIDQIRQLVNTAPRDIKAAIMATTKEATQAKCALSLQGKPSLKRVVTAHLMLDVYTSDCTREREYMRVLLRHHGLDSSDIGAALGNADLSTISSIGETHSMVEAGTLSLVYDANTDNFQIGATK